jgi:hypothetical protein
MTAGSDIGAVHHGLAVLHLPGDPGVLAGHPDTHLALFQLGGLIQDQHRAGVAEMTQDEPLRRAEPGLPSPGVLGQQCLQPPRRGMPSGLGQLPARPAVPWLCQQRIHVGERRQARPSLAKHRRKQPVQLLPQTPQPAAIPYDGRSGYLLILSSHKA